MKINESVQLASNFIRAGQLQEAEQICEEILRVQPNSAISFYLLGVVCLAKKDFHKAIQHFNMSIQYDPTNANAYFILGGVFQEMNRPEDAIICYERILEFNAKHCSALMELGNVYQRMCDDGNDYYEEHLLKSLEYYQKTIQINPQLIDQFNNLGLIVREDMQLPQEKVFLRNAPRRDMSRIEYVLASYPRSGNHWARYILELFSRRPTVTEGLWGKVIDFPVHEGMFIHKIADIEVDNPAPIALKVHKISGNLDLHRNLVFLVRDFNECIIRHLLQNTMQINWNKLDDEVTKYADLLQHYDTWPGKKILIYYEDLIQNYSSEIKRLVEFCEIFDKDKFSDLIANYHDHKTRSVKYYEKRMNIIASKGESTRYYVHFLPDDKKLLIQKKLVEKHSRIFNKYLSRYIQ